MSEGTQSLTDARYRINVSRRPASDSGYADEPWVAFAVRIEDDGLVAVQFGSNSAIAFAKALKHVEEDRQREPVSAYV